MKTYDDVIAESYASNPGYRNLYPDYDVFKKHYLKANGFKYWIELMRDSTLTVDDVNEIGRTYMSAGNRAPESIPTMLASLSRLYNVELPVVDGLFTAEYWRDIKGF